MELGTGRPAAAWHPFTSLVGLDSLAEDRQVSLLPVLEIFPRVAVSDLLHEATHLWSARVTRLGWFLAARGGPLLTSWRSDKGERLMPSDTFLNCLGLARPFLEGLALYAQLDYEEPAESACPVFSPVQAIRSLLEMDPRNPADPAVLYRGFREYALYRPSSQRPSLLKLTFATPQADTEHYAVGYLYIKALEASLIRKVPSLQDRPDWLLPLMIKVIADSPYLLQPVDYDSIPEQLDQFHRAIINLDIRVALPVVLREDVAGWFDWWDVYGQADSGQSDHVMTFSDQELVELGLVPSNDDMLTLRSAAGVHFIDWHTGTISFDEEGGIWLKRKGQDPVRPLGLDLRILYGDRLRAQDLHAALQAAQQRGLEVTLASFLVLHTGVLGAAMWSPALEPDTAWWYPFEPIDSLSQDICMSALAFSPEQRRAFSAALTGRAAARRACWASTDWIAGRLISSAASAAEFRRLGFLAPILQPVRDDLLDWCDPSPVRTQHWYMSAGAERALREILDLPGFPSVASDGTPYLFPSLPPTGRLTGGEGE